MNRFTADPEIKCFLPAVPRATYLPHLFQIIQAAKSIMIAYQFAGAVRERTDGKSGPEFSRVIGAGCGL